MTYKESAQQLENTLREFRLAVLLTTPLSRVLAWVIIKLKGIQKGVK